MDRERERVETVGTALSGVMVAGQHLLADRIDLALFEWRQSFGHFVTKLALLILGGLLLLSALVALDIVLIEWLASSGSRTTALVGCAGLHAAGGAGLLLVGLRRHTRAPT